MGIQLSPDLIAEDVPEFPHVHLMNTAFINCRNRFTERSNKPCPR